MTTFSRFGDWSRARPAASPPPPSLTSSSGTAAAPGLHAHRRAIRVVALVIAIILMSLGDLSMTLTQLRSVGMGEANPIARYVMSFNSPSLLAVWKCATVALACAIFLWARHRRSTEIACWTCAALLLALTIGWIQYANEAHKLTSTLDTVSGMECSLWVTMTPSDAPDTP